MGQAAEDALDGFACQECGTFFDDCLPGGSRCKETGKMIKIGMKKYPEIISDPPGHPRTCADCERPKRKRGRG